MTRLLRGARAVLMATVAAAGVVLVTMHAACAPHAEPDAALATGTTPNDVRLSRCGGQRVALVPASADARLDVLALDVRNRDESASSAPGVFFGAGSSPWAVASSGERAAVTLFGSGDVAWVDPCAGSVLSRVSLVDAVGVDPPVALRHVRDVDGDGVSDALVTRMIPRAPEGIAARDDVVWATYTNLLEVSAGPDEVPVLGPGMLARFVVRDDALTVDRAVVVPCSNPQGVVVDGEEAWVSCSGAFATGADGAQHQVTDGALVALDATTLDEKRVVPLPGRAPGTPALTPDAVVVGDLLDAHVFTLRRVDGLIVEDIALAAPGVVDSVFRITIVDGEVWAPLFSADRVFIAPGGATRTIDLDRGIVTRGLLAVDVDDEGAVGLLSLAAQLVPFARGGETR